jgi:hypothetical protein
MSAIFWDVSPCSLEEVKRRSEERTASIVKAEEYVPGLLLARLTLRH